MSKMALMQPVWESLHTQDRYRPRYPHEFVVRWVLNHFGNQKGAKILDVGCGAGRHAFFLAKEGFDTHVSDISREGVQFTLTRAKELGFSLQGYISSAHEMTFPDEFFDGVIAYESLYYDVYAHFVKSIDKIYSILRPSGKFFMVVRGDKDWRIGYGEKIGDYEYHLTKLGNGTPSDCEKDMVETFVSEEALKKILKPFQKVLIDYTYLSWHGGKYVDHAWIVSAEK